MGVESRRVRPFLLWPGYFLFTPDLKALRPPDRLRRSHAASLCFGSWIRVGLVLACVVGRPGRLRSGRFTRVPASESLSLCWPTLARSPPKAQPTTTQSPRTYESP